MYLFDVALTGLQSIRLHPMRSFVSVAALVAVLTPYLAGLALARGLEGEAEASARHGADMVVTGQQFGRTFPLPIEVVTRIRSIEGVTRVVPRIVGEVFLGRERIPAVLIGMPADELPEWAECVRGRSPRDGGGNELVLGSTLARRLSLDVDSALPPFYRNDKGERLSRIVGIFEPDAPLWQSQLILTTFETAGHIFDQPGLMTDLLVWCRPGYQAEVSRTIARDVSSGGQGGTLIRTGVTTREELLDTLPRGTLWREGVFTLHFVIAFAVAILVLLVTSGMGLAERRREIGILKATGWQTDEVLLRGAVESLCLSLAGACAALTLAWVWLRLLNGWGITGIFLTDGSPIDFPVPYRLTPVPSLLSFVCSLVIVLTGTLTSSWLAATASPREVMR